MQKNLAKATATLWALWVLIDYAAHHTYLTRSVADPAYPILLALLAGLAVAGGAWVHFGKRAQPLTSGYRGIYGFLGVQVAAAVVLTAFTSTGLLPEVSLPVRLGYFFGYSSLHLGGLFLLVTVAYAVGSALLEPLRLRMGDAFTISAIGLGTAVAGLLLTILGLLYFFKAVIIWPLLVIVLGLRWKAVLSFWRDSLWTRRTVTITRWWTPAIAIGLATVLGVNLIAAFKTFPIGYDGSALYVNLASLIANSGELPYGGQAFGWSVIMALGQTLFGSLTMTILLSHLTNVLLLLAVYRVARLFLSVETSLVATLLAASAPFLAFHGIIDEKTDMALTFVVLCGFLVGGRVLSPGPFPCGAANGGPRERGDVGDVEVDVDNSNRIAFFGGRWTPSATGYALLLVGFLAGFAFTIKYLALLYLIAFGAYVFYLHGGVRAFFGATLSALGLVFLGGLYRFGYLDLSGTEALLLGLVLLLAGGGLLFLAYRERLAELRQPVLQVGLTTILFMLAFTPWAFKHISEHGSIGVTQIIEGRSQAPDLRYLPGFSSLDQSEIRFSDYRRDNDWYLYNNWIVESYQESVENQTSQLYPTTPEPSPLSRGEGSGEREIYNGPISKPQPQIHLTQSPDPRSGRNAAEQAAREEIQRYLGYEPYFWRYFSLPYDLTMGTNLPGARYLDVGWLAWCFIPLLFLLLPGTRGRALVGGIGGAVLLIYLAGAWYSIYAEPGLAYDSREVVNRLTTAFAGHAGGNTSWFAGLYMAVITPLLALSEVLTLPFALLGNLTLWATIFLMLAATFGVYWLMRSRLATMPRAFKAFCGLLTVYGLTWWLLGNGIVWYGMPFFVLLPIAILWFLDEPERFLGATNKSFSGIFGGVVIGLLLAGNMAVYLTSSFPEDSKSEPLFRWPFVDVASNPNALTSKAIDSFNPAVSSIMTAINGDPSARVYRVNTHYGFFVENNDLRVFSDPTLDRYDEISSRLGDRSNFFDILKAQGFKYILFDLKTGMQDNTPEKSLQKKFISIAEILTTSEKVRVVATDNYISDPNAPEIRLPNGQITNARMGLRGNTVALGSLALFEIL